MEPTPWLYNLEGENPVTGASGGYLRTALESHGLMRCRAGKISVNSDAIPCIVLKQNESAKADGDSKSFHSQHSTICAEKFTSLFSVVTENDGSGGYSPCRRFIEKSGQCGPGRPKDFHHGIYGREMAQICCLTLHHNGKACGTEGDSESFQSRTVERSPNPEGLSDVVEKMIRDLEVEF